MPFDDGRLDLRLAESVAQDRRDPRPVKKVTPIFTEPKVMEFAVKLWEDKRAGRMDKPPSSNRSRTP